MRRRELSDEEWNHISDLMPVSGGRGKPWKDHRLMISGMLWIHSPQLFSCTRAVLVALVAGLGAMGPDTIAQSRPRPPVIPVGLDAFRQWDRWDYQRIGARAYMRSTYDRRGGNEAADASHFLYQLSEDRNVTLDVAGAGVLYFCRYNHWHGSPWRYVIDGVDHTVEETSTPDPNRPIARSVFEPHDQFPSPLALTWSTTKGADLSWVPIGFQNSFRMEYSRTHYGTGYYIYDQYVGGARLSQPIKAWRGNSAPDSGVLKLIGKAGMDLSPENSTSVGGVLRRLQPRETRRLLLLSRAPSTIRKLSFSVPLDQALAFGSARLRITWDNRKEPSVNAPVALFFGAGILYNRDHREYLVKAFPSTIRYGGKRVELSFYFPMPFFKSAQLDLVGGDKEAVNDVDWNVRFQPFHGQPSEVGYFHATYRDHPHPAPGKDLVLLDTHGIEGKRDWSGSFVGTSFIFSDRANLNTLEGDPRFFFDDSLTPQAYGTGTEEWGGGGDYWGGANMTLPFAGHPIGAASAKSAENKDDLVESAYRFLLSDLMPFGKAAVIHLEHGGENESTEHYQTVTYWYGAPAPSLIKTDELKIGNLPSEQAHRYVSPSASAPYAINSRYEWGVDSRKVNGKSVEVYPPHTDLGRKTTGGSEFTLRLVPRNLGVLLRRKLDYAFPNQKALVFVKSALRGRTGGVWKSAGVWYLAGSNTCVFSAPEGELGMAQHIVQTSNRRFRDDEFLISRALTQGRSAIRVRVKFVPIKTPLFPGHPLGELAWSEIRYDAYCFVLPVWHS